MTPWIRRIALAVGALLVLLVGGAAWLIASFDPNRYKGVAIDWMKTNRHRTLAIDGPIELSVFPRLAVKLSKVSLSEPDSADNFAAVDSAALAVELMPLLQRELVIGRVEAGGVRVSVRRDAKGRFNFDDLAGAAGPKEAAPESSSPNLHFDVSRIALSDLRARIQDARGGIDGELVLKELTSGRIASGVESPVTLAAGFDFKAPALKGSLSGSTTLTPDVATGSVRLAAMKLAYVGDLPGATGIDAKLEGALAWDGAKGALDAQGLALQLAATAAGVKLAGSSLAVERFAYDPSRQALQVAKLQLHVKGSRAGQPLAFDLDWPQLDVTGDKLQGSPLSGSVALGGETPVNASFKSGAPTGSFSAFTLPGFEARIGSEAAARKVNGTLRSQIGVRPSKGSVALDGLDLQATLQDKELKPMTLALHGDVAGSAQSATWKLAGKVNANVFTIDGNANLAGITPFVKAQARFDALDLNTLLPPAAGGAAPGTPAAANAPIDLSALRSLNADVGVRAGNFVFRQYRVADARIDALLDGGILKVTALQGKAWGGSLDASALADARASRIAVKAVANGVNVNALLKDVAAKDILEGTGRVSADIDTAGRTVGELRARLHGSASLQLRDGAIKGINLAKSFRQAKAALTLKQDAAQKASQTEKTDFSELSASFKINDGVARSNDLDAKSPFLRLGGDGAADIGKGTIDYTVRATVTATAAGQDAGDMGALKGLTIPVRLAGPFEAIDWKIQWSAIAAGALKNQVTDKLAEKLGLKPADGAASDAKSPKDQLKDKLLKGLFK